MTNELEPASDTEVEVVTDDANGRWAALHDLATRLPQAEKDMDAIRRFVARRAFPEDWTVFKKQGSEGTAEMSNAAASRIAADLGISFVNWSKTPTKVIDEDGHYTYWYSCDVKYRSRVMEGIEGRASSRDAFFRKINGKTELVINVREDDVRTAARRNAIKSGVAEMTGLRRVPLSVLRGFGINEKAFSIAEFETKGKTLAADQTKPDQDNLILREIAVAVVAKGGQGTGPQGPWIRWDVTDKEGVRYSLFAPENSKRLAILNTRAEDQLPIKIKFHNKPYPDKSGKTRDSYIIDKVEGASE